MRSLSISTLLIVLLFLSSCSKNNTPAPGPKNTGSVVIMGATYPTIIIGKQTWTSFNYNSSTGSFTSTSSLYGNYYTLAQATQITLPTGWRIPTRADYNTLLSNFTSNKNSLGDYSGDISVARALADTAQFHSLSSFDLTMRATNSSGFSAYPGGAYDITNKAAVDVGIGGAYLTATTGTENATTVNYFFGVTADGVGIGSVPAGYFAGIDFNYNPYAYSLRFVKDN
jgi:uncharacterized protein (TIGR02145 family)